MNIFYTSNCGAHVRDISQGWVAVFCLVFASFCGATLQAEATFEVQLSDGESISSQSENARVVALEPSFLELKSKDYLVRIQPDFVELEGSEKTDEIRYRNTLVKMYRDVDGLRQEILCVPDKEQPVGSAIRATSTPDEISITFEVQFEICRTLYTEESVGEEFLPLRLEGTVGGDPTRFD